MKIILHALVLIVLAVPSTAFAEEVYMVRGFLGVFSGGMNQMAEKLEQRGVNVETLGHGGVTSLAKDIIQRAKKGKVSYPIIIAGHSLGGREVVNFSNRLGSHGIPVKLAIGIDPGFPKPAKFKKGARRVINYRIPNGHDYERAKGNKTTKIKNIIVEGVSHSALDDDKEVQRRILKSIMSSIN